MNETPKTLTVTECHQLLDALLHKQGTKKQFRRGVRNYTIACLMLEAGLRVGEATHLLVSDLWYLSRPVTSIIVRAGIAKNRRERQIPVSTRLSDALKEMARTYWSSNMLPDQDYAFYRTNRNIPLTTRQVERIIRAAAIRSIGRPIHPHVLRHTFGTRLMRKTNARIVQELLGHSSMTSTQIYTHPNSDDLKSAINKMNEAVEEEIQPGMHKYSPPGVSNGVDTTLTDGDVG